MDGFPGISNVGDLEISVILDGMTYTVAMDWSFPHPESKKDFSIAGDCRLTVTVHNDTKASAYGIQAEFLIGMDKERQGLSKFGGFTIRLTDPYAGPLDRCGFRVPGPWFPNTFVPPGATLADFIERSTSFHSAPDSGFGLMVMIDKDSGKALGTWMDTGLDTCCIPSVVGNGTGVSLTFREEKGQFMAPGDRVGSGVLHIAYGSDTEAVLKGYERTVEQYFQGTEPTPEWVRGMVLLEAYPAYYQDGLKGLTARIPFYRGIGFNSIYLMPHWQGGYMPVDPFKVDPAIGSEEDLKTFVETAHANGMKVLFDMVIHGFSAESPCLRIKPCMFCRDESGEIAEHRTWKSKTTDWADPEFQGFMEELVLHDQAHYGNDGYRVDAASYKGPNWDPGKAATGYAAYRGGSESPAVIGRMIKSMRKANPDAVMLSEVFGPGFHSVCDLLHDNQTEAVQQFLELLSDGRVTAEDYKEHMAEVFDMLPDGANRVFFSRNHDTSWFYHFNGYTPRFMAMEAIHALCAIPEVFGGDPNHGPNPEDDERIWDSYKALFSLRSKNPVFTRGKLLLRGIDSTNPMVFTAARCLEDTTIIIAVSLSDSVESVEISLNAGSGITFGPNGSITDVNTGTAFQDGFKYSGPGKITLEIQPCQVLTIHPK